MAITTSDRVLAVLSLFTVERPEWTVEEAAAALSFSVSTTYRYVRSLNQAGMLVAIETGRYILGPAFIRFDRQIRLSDPVLKSAVPVMRDMTQDVPSGSVCILCGLYRDEVICLHQEYVAGPHLSVGYERGRPMPLFRGAASKIILANMSARDVRRLFTTLPQAQEDNALGPDWEQAKRTLRRLRSAGVCITRGEIDPGLVGISAALFGVTGEVIGSIGFVVDEAQLKSDEALSLGRKAILAANKVLESLREGRSTN